MTGVATTSVIVMAALGGLSIVAVAAAGIWWETISRTILDLRHRYLWWRLTRSVRRMNLAVARFRGSVNYATKEMHRLNVALQPLVVNDGGGSMPPDTPYPRGPSLGGGGLSSPPL